MRYLRRRVLLWEALWFPQGEEENDVREKQFLRILGNTKTKQFSNQSVGLRGGDQDLERIGIKKVELVRKEHWPLRIERPGKAALERRGFMACYDTDKRG